MYRNLVFDFTHTYTKAIQDIDSFKVIDCSNMSGVTGYCSEEAKKKLKEIISPYGISGIHFLDSGDYHYMTEIMTSFIHENFILVLIDHHTDMQEGMIDMTSCGDWALEVLKHHPYLKQLVLIGQDRYSLIELEKEHLEKVLEISYETLIEGKGKNALEKILSYPIYLSIDKDVLDQDESITNWDQGKMTLNMLENLLQYIINKNEIIGVDICGDDPEEENLPEFIHAQRVNTSSDEKLLQYLLKLFHKKRL